ncbi:MAG: hypothetical protein ACT4NV_17990 [Rhodoferax sp.]
MNPSDDEMQKMRQQFAAQQLDVQSVQLAVIEQMWLELARALAAQGVLNAEALALRLEEHALRAQHLPGWFYGLTDAAQALRQPGVDAQSLVQ